MKSDGNFDALVQAMVEFINQKWEQETSSGANFYAGAQGDEVAARELIEDFITYCDQTKISPVKSDFLVGLMVEYIRQKWAQDGTTVASLNAGSQGNEVTAREHVENFVKNYKPENYLPLENNEVRTCFLEMKKVLKRVLDVDMENPANRKGALPKALGLVSRKKAGDIIEDRVIFFAFEYARRELGDPDRPFEQCAELIAYAGEETGYINAEPDNIIKTYQRMMEEIRGK